LQKWLTNGRKDGIITASGDNPAVRKQFLWIETKTEMETIMISWSHPQRSLALRRAFLLPKWRETGANAARFHPRFVRQSAHRETRNNTREEYHGH
jgi:hypothetical protein